MSFGQTQYLADRKAEFVADTVFTDGATIKILNAGGSAIATASDGVASDTNNEISITSAGGASITSTDTATGFSVEEGTGNNACYTFQNLTLTVASADISTANDTFTATAHGLPEDIPMVIGGDIPTASPAVSTGDTVYIVDTDTNTFKIARESGGAAVDITDLTGVTNTTFTLKAVGAVGSGSIMEITGGTSLTSGNVATFNTLKFIEDVFSRKAFS